MFIINFGVLRKKESTLSKRGTKLINNLCFKFNRIYVLVTIEFMTTIFNNYKNMIRYKVSSEKLSVYQKNPEHFRILIIIFYKKNLIIAVLMFRFRLKTYSNEILLINLQSHR